MKIKTQHPFYAQIYTLLSVKKNSIQGKKMSFIELPLRKLNHSHESVRHVFSLQSRLSRMYYHQSFKLNAGKYWISKSGSYRKVNFYFTGCRFISSLS